MDAVTMVTTFAVLGGALAFVGWPLANPSLAEADTTAREKRRDALDDEKERLLDALGDLDHDRRTGKMEEGDFDTLTARLKVEAAQVLRDIDVNEGRKTLKAGETLEPVAKPDPAAKTEEKPVQPPAGDDEIERLRRQAKEREAERARLEAENKKNEERVKAKETSNPAADAAGAFCTKCGRRAKSIEDRFCGKCGAALPDDVAN
jgi:hypothetical protein